MLHIRKLTLKTSLIIFQLLTTGFALQATNYYVATTGNNSSDGKTISTPFNTLVYAISKVVPGDTIFVRAGTYTVSSTISMNKSGSSVSSRVCIFAYRGDERPILDFSGMAYGSSNRGINFSGSYCHMKGIRIHAAGDNGMNMTGSNNIIEFCDFYENRDGGFQMGGGAHDNRIINCDSYRNADYGTGISDDGGDADGFSPKMDVGTNNYYYGCRAWLNSDDGWDGYLRGTTAEVVTTLENCWTWKNGYYWKDGTTTSAMNGNGFKQGGSDTKDLAHSFVVKNCLSFYNKGNGYDQNSSTGSQTLYNCTSVGNVGKSYYFNSSVTLATGKVFTLTNCIAYNNTSTSFRSGTILTTNNFSTSASDFASVDTTGISGPRKADGSLPDVNFMHLSKTGSLIDKGTNIGLTFAGAAPDLGCFETGLTTGIAALTTGNEALRLSCNSGTLDIILPQTLGNTFRVALYDLSGRKIRNLESNTNNHEDYHLNIADLSPEVYICKLVSENQYFIGKFVKK